MKPKMIKKIVLILLFFLLSGFVHAGGSEENKVQQLTIYGIKGASGLGMIRLFEEPPRLRSFEVKVEALAHVDLMTARFISGEAKVGILPPNVAAKIRSSGRDIRAAALIGAGMLALLSSDPNLRSFEGLRGKTVEVAGQGATPDYVFRRLLSRRGLVPDRDVKLGYSLAYPEIAQSLIAGRISIALLPEPFASMARMGNPSLRSVADIQDEWIKAGGAGNYPMTLLVVDGAFADSNAASLEQICSAAKNSIEWVRAHPSDAGLLAEKHELGLKAAVAAEAIPKSNYEYVPAALGRASLESLFGLFLEYSPVSIGGALPDDGFYLK